MSEELEISYYQKRCNAIGLTSERNILRIPESPGNPNNKNTIDQPLLAEDPKTGDILIPLYDLNGKPCVFNKYGTANKTGTTTASRTTYIEVRRYKPGNERKTKDDRLIKYDNPKGAKTLPWISPNIIEAYRTKTEVNTLIITEGYIKAISGYLNGLYIFGLAGIQNVKDKDTTTLHPDILKAITELKVKNVVLLYDGDCNNISLTALSEGKDLYQRPHGFFTSARNICELLKDTRKNQEFDIYFAHVNSSELENQPKGLDDLFESFPTEFTDITKELTSFSRTKNHYFQKFNITFGLSKVLNHLHINNQETFYTFHNQTIGEREFIFNGTKYQFNTEKNELKTIIPGAAKNYFRVGDHYFEHLSVPDKNGQLEMVYHRRMAGTITADHGRNFLQHVPKYKAWCTKPDHVNFQAVINNCYNRYKPFEHEPAPDSQDCPVILEFLKHIFADQLELGLDYIQLLYQRPTQMLPILCLVSKENNTGKSTFGKLLKGIFKGNMATIGNADLENDFNGGWADRLIICCEESFIDKKKTIEKIKALSTGDKIQINMKGVDQIEIDFFGKFIFMSNNEDNFLIANEHDERFWVRRVPKAEKENTNLLDQMEEEIPAFLSYLNHRNMSTKKESRMWFAPALLRTDALKKLIDGNRSTAEREIRAYIRHTMMEYGFNELQYTLKFIVEEILRKRYESNYIERLINEKIHIEKSPRTKRFKFPVVKNEFLSGNEYEERIILNAGLGKPYIFKAANFLNQAELEALELCDQADQLKVYNAGSATQLSISADAAPGIFNNNSEDSF